MKDASAKNDGVSTLSVIAKQLADRELPPVETWNPARSGDSEMRIARDGTWFHQGSPILRPAMVKLFSTILRREPDGSHVLVTPAEKLTIEVEDAPFVAVALASTGSGAARMLAFRLNTDEYVVAGKDNPIRIAGDGSEPSPYVRVRRGLEALISRPVYYELANAAVDEGNTPAGLWSGGVFFDFETAA